MFKIYEFVQFNYSMFFIIKINFLISGRKNPNPSAYNNYSCFPPILPEYNDKLLNQNLSNHPKN